MNFRYRFMQFISGRYGRDKLFDYLVVFDVALSVINLIFRSYIVQLLVYAVLVYALFRFMSRNLEARRRENAWFNSKLNFAKSRKEFYEQKKADKFHVYRKCPSCKAILRLPHRIGVHTTVCPRCNKEFTVKVKK